MKRFRAKFIKDDSVRFLSHLDILRTFGRAVRRSGIPIVYSKGFNPHPSMSFALPLSVGVTSEGEFVDMDIENDDMSKVEFVETINKGLPQGLKVVDAEEVDVKSNIMSLVRSARYKVTIYGENLNDVDNKVSSLLSKNEILVDKETKKGVKEADIRPNIQSMSVQDKAADEVELLMTLDAGSVANLKPDTVVKALEKYYDIKVEDFDVHRIELVY